MTIFRSDFCNEKVKNPRHDSAAGFLHSKGFLMRADRAVHAAERDQDNQARSAAELQGCASWPAMLSLDDIGYILKLT
ncbi:hypothetical protein [Bordetella sp.]|uniref:hypothetical protein n=1 Tax=Bordetella sp. TaxID=28081 RepID=UPI003F7B5D72